MLIVRFYYGLSIVSMEYLSGTRDVFKIFYLHSWKDYRPITRLPAGSEYGCNFYKPVASDEGLLLFQASGKRRNTYYSTETWGVRRKDRCHEDGAGLKNKIKRCWVRAFECAGKRSLKTENHIWYTYPYEANEWKVM